MTSIIGTDPNQVPTNGDLGTLAYQDYDVVAPQFLSGGRKNIIKNGSMQIHQRGGTLNSVSGNKYVLDRFALGVYGSGTGAMSGQQITTTGVEGLRNAFRATVTTTDTPSGTEAYLIYHPLEGQDLRPAHFGLSTSRPLSLSFYARSSVAGTYAVTLQDGAAGKALTHEYTLEADTWKRVECVIPAYTSGSNWNLDSNTRGGILAWGLGGLSGSQREAPYNDAWYDASGYTMTRTFNSTNWINNSGATFDLTGVQLEVGTVATPFETLTYGEELTLCSRYYHEIKQFVFNANKGNDTYWDGHARAGSYPFPVPMRASPSVTIVQTFGWLANTSGWTTPSSGRHPVSIGVTNEQNVAFTGSNYWDDPGTGGSAGTTTAVRIEKATVDAEL